ncbi:DUF1839 family protein [Reyranella sp.]|uniref:DUF1839 family protein n=1 Tax=Reyranella sp. TaxID=1929291 RepID=UPI003D0E3A40
MSSDSDSVDLLGLSPTTWRPSTLHGGDRVWPETNCYVDVWVELLTALDHPVEAALAFTVLQDFEGDHFTFFKFPLEDLQTLYGLSVQELAIYESVEARTIVQLRRGRPVLVEVDAFWLPDAVEAYRKAHVKTSIAVIALDPRRQNLGYFHGIGYHEARGEDYEGLFHQPISLFPYAEFVKRDSRALEGADLREASLALLRRHLRHRPGANPIGAWRAAQPVLLAQLAKCDMAYFHLHAFNVPRQLGANFEMLATYLNWLGAGGVAGLADAAAASRRIAEAARAAQFQLARMVHRRKFDAGALALRAMEKDYDFVFATLTERFA